MGEVIDITSLMKNPKDKEVFGVLLIEFNKTSCTFQVVFEDKEKEVLELDREKVVEAIHRMFQVIQVLSEEFNIDI